MNARPTQEAELPATLIEAVRFFSDIDKCNEQMARIKWPDGKITCPHCDGERIGKIETRKLLRCKDCRKQFSYKVGTIFEDSPLGLDKWFVAVWCIANAKNGISSHELRRALGVTQKSAWFMLHRVRLAMQTGSFRKPLEGEVEADETFIGGRMKFMHKSKRAAKPKGRGTVGKVIVQGLLQRSTEDAPSYVQVSVVPNQKRQALQYEIRQSVMRGTVVYTDSLPSYEGLSSEYIHKMIDHAVSYVEGRVHTNGIENFWSLLKRMLRGTYVAVSPWHLFRYLDEEAYRFNWRKQNDGERFAEVMGRVVGKRIQYKELIGADA
jgi:transposase-like protein